MVNRLLDSKLVCLDVFVVSEGRNLASPLHYSANHIRSLGRQNGFQSTPTSTEEAFRSFIMHSSIDMG
jgi:hypothetical protein